MPTLSDTKIRALYKRIETEREGDPQRLLGDQDLVELLGAIADRPGVSANRAKKEIADAAGVDQMASIAKRGMSAGEKRDVEAILYRGSVPLSATVKQILQKMVGGEPVNPPPPPSGESAAFHIKKGRMGFMLNDDKVISTADGAVRGTSGVPGFARSYVAKSDGVLRSRHGTAAPSSTVHSTAETKSLHEMPPGKALDAAAKLFGVKTTGFEKMAHDKVFFDPSADGWEGLCHSWSWVACSKTACALVDVDGPAGLQGRWIGGQWLSRADLGNWLMAVSHIISMSAREKLWDDKITALDTLRVAGQYLINDGGGVVGDIHNDEAKGTAERWNQPFVGADIDAKTITGPAAMGVIGQALADGFPGGVTVKHFHVVARYCDEVADDHEGPPDLGQRDWHIYTVHDAEGVALAGYMADDDKLAQVSGLPTYNTDPVVDYFLRPRVDCIDEVIKGKSVWYVDDDEYGTEFKFFVAHALACGVPGSVRADFETAVAALPKGQLSAAALTDLEQRFAAAGIANAYSPEEWATHFQSRGLEAKSFGAAWKA